METDTAYRVKRQRPDKIVIASRDEAKGLRLVSDGRNVYTYQAGTNSYTVTEISDDPGGLGATLVASSAMASGGDLGLMMFIGNFLVGDFYEEIMVDITELQYLGREEIDGTPCHHLRFIEEGGFADAWFTQGDTPVFKKIVGELSMESPVPMSIKIEMAFSNWDLNADLADSEFDFGPPPDAKKVASLMPDLSAFGVEGEELQRFLDDAEASQPSRSAPAGDVTTQGLELAWSTEGAWQAVAVSDTKKAIYAVSTDGRFTQFSPSGEMEEKFTLGRGGFFLRTANLAGDGSSHFIVFMPWGPTVDAYDLDGELVWSYQVGQGVDDVWCADLDGDGMDEVIIGYNGSTGLHVLDNKGALLWKFTQIGNVWHVSAGDVDGDGTPEVVTTSASGQVHVFDGRGNHLKSLEPGLYGNMVRVGTGSERSPEAPIFAGGNADTGVEMVRLSVSGNEEWRVTLPGGQARDSIDSTMVIGPKPWIAVGMRGGTVFVIDGESGTVVAVVGAQGMRPQTAWLDSPGVDPLLLVATGSRLNAFRLKPTSDPIRLTTDRGVVQNEEGRPSAPQRPSPPSTTTVKNDKMVFSLPDLTGKIVSSEDEQFKGKVVVVDIWGSWCPPCRVELPHLVRLYEKYHDQGLEIVGLSFEQGGNQARQLERLKEFVKDNNMDYTVLYGGSTSETERKLPAVENFGGYPTTIFIGRDGRVKKVKVGFADFMAPEMEETIQELLGAK